MLLRIDTDQVNEIEKAKKEVEELTEK